MGKWIDIGAESDNVDTGDDDYAGATTVSSENSDNDEVGNGKDDINKQRREKKIMNIFFIIIPTISERFLK